MSWQRFVAIGDSTVEGLVDPDANGGYRGWADRLAEHLAWAQGEVCYANLAVRGRKAHQVRLEQLPAARALRPDLVAAVAGVNDLLRPGLELAPLLAHLEAILAELREDGATVVTFTQPGPVADAPLLRGLRGRLAAYNAGLREVAARTGVRLLDLAATPIGADPRLWHHDRLHANSLGHARVAAGLAALLGLPGANERWAAPLPSQPPPSPRERLAQEGRWLRDFVVPFAARRLRGRSSGDGRGPKLPEPVRCTATG